MARKALSRSDFTPDLFDACLNAELLLPDSGNNTVRARVVKQAKGKDGNPIGSQHNNPLFDTCVYTVEFPDGSTAKHQANVIAENLFSQSDLEGQQCMVMKETCDHRKDGRAIPILDGFTTSKNGNKCPKTTIGWQLLVEWNNGSSDWMDLKDLKESNPVEIAEHAVANKIVEEPAFKWWVANALRGRNRIMSNLEVDTGKLLTSLEFESPRRSTRPTNWTWKWGQSFGRGQSARKWAKQKSLSIVGMVER
jgi:hypothetical protein